MTLHCPCISRLARVADSSDFHRGSGFPAERSLQESDIREEARTVHCRADSSSSEASRDSCSGKQLAVIVNDRLSVFSCRMAGIRVREDKSLSYLKMTADSERGIMIHYRCHTRTSCRRNALARCRGNSDMVLGFCHFPISIFYCSFTSSRSSRISSAITWSCKGHSNHGMPSMHDCGKRLLRDRQADEVRRSSRTSDLRPGGVGRLALKGPDSWGIWRFGVWPRGLLWGLVIISQKNY